MTLFFVGSGSAIGALLRFWFTILLKKQSAQFPLATLLINLSGSFLLGLLVGLSVSKETLLFFGTGVLGGFTTFSTMNEEMVRLWHTDRKRAYYYLFLTYGLGLVLCFLGIIFGMAIPH